MTEQVGHCSQHQRLRVMASCKAETSGISIDTIFVCFSMVWDANESFLFSPALPHWKTGNMKLARSARNNRFLLSVFAVAVNLAISQVTGVLWNGLTIVYDYKAFPWRVNPIAAQRCYTMPCYLHNAIELYWKGIPEKAWIVFFSEPGYRGKREGLNTSIETLTFYPNASTLPSHPSWCGSRASIRREELKRFFARRFEIKSAENALW